MEHIETIINQSQIIAWTFLAVSFIVLAKCADMFVESAVALAEKFKIPRLIIGIVLVSLATTTPEVSVSVIAAMKGSPEMALGNAIGSVICDDGIALGLAGVAASAPILIIPNIFNISAVFLLAVEGIAFFFIVFDGQLGRLEGGIFILLLISYLLLLYRQHTSARTKRQAELIELEKARAIEKQPMILIVCLFLLGLAGIIVSSRFIVSSAVSIAHFIGIPEAVIALTLVAVGTSIPEIATCIIAARKNEGALAVGNILGADILNICWVAGLSAVVKPLSLSAKQIAFMFPSMFVIVGAMLVMLRINYRLTRIKGAVLLLLYTIYVVSFFFVFPPSAAGR